MNGRKSLARRGAGLLVLLALLVVVVLVSRPSAAPGDRKNATTNQTTPVVVVRTQPDGTIECSDLTSAPGHQGTLVYQWTGPRLQTARCTPAAAGGVVGLG